MFAGSASSTMMTTSSSSLVVVSNNTFQVKKEKKTSSSSTKRRTKRSAHRRSGEEEEEEDAIDYCANRSDFDAFERALSSLSSSSSSRNDANTTDNDNDYNEDIDNGKVKKKKNLKTAVSALCASLCLSTEVFLLSSGFAFPREASALLSNPNSGLPRTPTAALRRATPRVNAESSDIQYNLDDAAYQFRIPQRKPWNSMLNEIKKAKEIVKEKRGEIFQPIVKETQASAEVEIENLVIALDRLILACENQDVENFDKWIAKAIEANGNIMVNQVNDLPFLLPKRYQELPRMTGRAELKFTIKHGDGSSFGNLNGEPLKTVDLEITCDGFNAPITAGNFVDAVKRGEFDGSKLNLSETAVIFGNSDNSASTSIPLEVKASNEFEPRYRSPLDVASGIDALPSIPLSVNGSVSAMRSATDDGASSSSQFFLFNFDRRQAGLGGVAFEEGEFSTFGYVTKGLDYVRDLRKGDVIVKASVTAGEDRLVNPSVSRADRIDEIQAAELADKELLAEKGV